MRPDPPSAPPEEAVELDLSILPEPQRTAVAAELAWMPPGDRAVLARDLERLVPEDRAIVASVLPYTMTSVARLQALIDSVRYCVRRELPGAFVECGVWRGGSVMAILLTLAQLGVTDREVHLFDTFEGMTAPTEHDTSDYEPASARETWEEAERRQVRPWAHWFDADVFSQQVVRDNLHTTGYPEERLHLVQGPVEQTLPEHAPGEIALLRLDTDWYESTRHELIHLYPRLRPSGVLIIDDYGHWKGSKRAVDEYFSGDTPALMLNRIDYAGRIAVKC